MLFYGLNGYFEPLITDNTLAFDYLKRKNNPFFHTNAK
ncbi:hypothetical protein PEPS_20360 [Persicobacter psychrovividus]|uniref:Uncharacterized protein n=1 Tax=Persicobacter psychrovividus TaxID=387638 RepID=A0ABM7VFL0_9BACT|nr:hypothetical protein PEPS_20360 [Persicobacter psychrovividus]